MDLRPAAPTAQTTPASAIGTSAATLGANVNAHNQATTYRFEYGPTTAYGSATATQALSASDDAPRVTERSRASPPPRPTTTASSQRTRPGRRSAPKQYVIGNQ